MKIYRNESTEAGRDIWAKVESAASHSQSGRDKRIAELKAALQELGVLALQSICHDDHCESAVPADMNAAPANWRYLRCNCGADEIYARVRALMATGDVPK